MEKIQYMDQQRSIIRAAREGDKGFNADLNDQVVIQMGDGSERVVSRSEAQESPPNYKSGTDWGDDGWHGNDD